MYTLYFTFSITTVVFCLLLISYFPIVWLNITFTFSDLSLQDVPFYAECSSNIVDSTLCTLVDFVYSTDRYHFYWFIMATDALLIVAVFLPWTTMMYLIMYGQWCNIFLIHTLPSAIIAGLQLLKVIILILGWLICKSVNFCRNFDSASGANPNNANWIYIATVIYSVVFTIISTIYALLYTVFESGIREYQKELDLIKKSPPPTSTSSSSTAPDPQQERYSSFPSTPAPEQQRYSPFPSTPTPEQQRYSSFPSTPTPEQPRYSSFPNTPDPQQQRYTPFPVKRRKSNTIGIRGDQQKKTV